MCNFLCWNVAASVAESNFWKRTPTVVPLGGEWGDDAWSYTNFVHCFKVTDV